jgi:hypothetical protein
MLTAVLVVYISVQMVDHFSVQFNTRLDKPMSRFGHADATQGKQVASDGVITA